MDIKDVIIIGGGIYGLMLAREAKLKNLNPLLLEKGRIGHQTTINSSQIIHGGLRYLQNLDLKRHRESVQERAWFLKTYPNFIKPLPCIFPIYNQGFYRKSSFRLAFFLDRCLSAKGGDILTKDETIALFPQVDQNRLKGSALWEDGTIVNQDVFIQQITQEGGVVHEQEEFQKLLIENGEVLGVQTNKGSYRAKLVINAAGPWCRSIAKREGQDIPNLFFPSLAFNLLFNRKPLSTAAIALVTPARTYFLRPMENQLFAGTYHLPWSGPLTSPTPPEEHIERFLSDLNHAIPGIELKKEEIQEVRAGFLPVQTEGTVKLASREVIIDHGMRGGPKGFYSVSGVKWTMARLIAEKTISGLPKLKG